MVSFENYVDGVVQMCRLWENYGRVTIALDSDGDDTSIFVQKGSSEKNEKKKKTRRFSSVYVSSFNLAFRSKRDIIHAWIACQFGNPWRSRWQSR